MLSKLTGWFKKHQKAMEEQVIIDSGYDAEKDLDRAEDGSLFELKLHKEPLNVDIVNVIYNKETGEVIQSTKSLDDLSVSLGKNRAHLSYVKNHASKSEWAVLVFRGKIVAQPTITKSQDLVQKKLRGKDKKEVRNKWNCISVTIREKYTGIVTQHSTLRKASVAKGKCESYFHKVLEANPETKENDEYKITLNYKRTGDQI